MAIIKGDSKLKALIVSDNHKNLESLKELVDIYEEEIDLWLHCGDSEFMKDHVIWDYFKTVKGNMDIDYSLQSHQLLKFGDQNILLIHGHQQRVGFTFERLNELAEKEGANIVFYGHTHIARVDKVDGKYFINPGSITQPRGSLRLGSYAIYEKNKEGTFITFYDWNHNELPELSRKIFE